jgi:hypothetical protein
VSITPSIDVVILIRDFLQSLVRTKSLWDKLVQKATDEGIDGEGLKILLQHHAKRLGIPRASYWRYAQELEDSTSRSAPLEQNDDNNVLEEANIQVINGDFIELSEKLLSDNSVDLIFTDPPYQRQDLHLYTDLGRVAARVLRPGGSLVTYVGHYALLDIGNMLRDSGLTYWWQLIMKHGGQHASMYQKRVFVEYKPLLWFVKGSLDDNDDGNQTEFIADFIQSEASTKEYHDWQQSTVEAEYIISKLTKPGSLVFDPFLGSATTALAAHKLGRLFIGMEIDPQTFANAKARLSKEMQPMQH